jgi:hypothetical protein
MKNQPTNGTADSSLTVITGGTLIDGTGRPPVQDAVVTIKGNRFESVFQTAKSAPPDARRIDAGGKTILPGLFDMHLHYKDFFPELLLHWGVTSVRDMGNDAPVWMVAQREFINRGLIYGPRLFTVGISMESRATGHHRCVMTPDEGIQTCKWLFDMLQVDGVKVYRRIFPDVYKAIAREALANGKWLAVHFGNVERVDGRRLGLTATEAAEIGVHSLEHGFGVPEAAVDDPEEIREMNGVRRDIVCWNLAKADRLKKVTEVLVEKNVYICPTILNRWEEVFPQRAKYGPEDEKILSDPNLAYVPTLYREGFKKLWSSDSEIAHSRVVNSEGIRLKRQALDRYYQFLRDFVNAGGRVIPGTGAGNTTPGIALHREMELMVDAGLEPMEVICASTLRSAEFLGVSEQLGSVEPGKLADLVVVDGDPLRDISSSRNVSTVIKDGKVLDIDFHADYRNPLPRPFQIGDHEDDLREAFDKLDSLRSLFLTRPGAANF